jgi:hypothetical protein
MKLLKKYLKTVHDIYEYFDYVSGEKIFPLEDYTLFNWTTNSNKLYYSIDDDDYITDDYIEEYIGEEFTMFLIKDSLNLDNCLIIFNNKLKNNK